MTREIVPVLPLIKSTRTNLDEERPDEDAEVEVIEEVPSDMLPVA